MAMNKFFNLICMHWQYKIVVHMHQITFHQVDICA